MLNENKWRHCGGRIAEFFAEYLGTFWVRRNISMPRAAHAAVVNWCDGLYAKISVGPGSGNQLNLLNVVLGNRSGVLCTAVLRVEAN